MVCGLCFPCFTLCCGCKPAGYTGKLSVWYGPVAGTYGQDAESGCGRTVVDKYRSGGIGGGLPAGAEGRGQGSGDVATFYVSVGDAPSKPGVIHQWHDRNRLTEAQQDDLARNICLAMINGGDVCYCPGEDSATVETAVSPNTESILEAAGLAGQGLELRAEGPPPWQCGREAMLGCVYLNVAGEPMQAAVHTG